MCGGPRGCVFLAREFSSRASRIVVVVVAPGVVAVAVAVAVVDVVADGVFLWDQHR